MSFPDATRGCCDFNQILACRYVKQEAYQMCEVWCNFNHGQLSYNNYLFDGESLIFAVWPKQLC